MEKAAKWQKKARLERIATALMPSAAKNAAMPQMGVGFDTRDGIVRHWDRDEWRRNMAIEAVAQAKALIAELDREDSHGEGV